jgi:branched-chain amino acid transport system substrate-binding protein
MFFSMNALSATDQPIRIGLSGPFTGGSAPMGESMRNGVRLAVEEINGIGGVNGRLIELIERDDQANNELGARIADEFPDLNLYLVDANCAIAKVSQIQETA